MVATLISIKARVFREFKAFTLFYRVHIFTSILSVFLKPSNLSSNLIFS